MPSTTRTLTDRLAKLRQALPENDPALAMHRDQRLMLHFVLAAQATRWPADLREDEPTLDQPAVPGYLSPSQREFRAFVRAELSAIERPEPIPSERVFVASFLWVNFLDVLNAPPPTRRGTVPDVATTLLATASPRTKVHRTLLGVTISGSVRRDCPTPEVFPQGL